MFSKNGGNKIPPKKYLVRSTFYNFLTKNVDFTKFCKNSGANLMSPKKNVNFSSYAFVFLVKIHIRERFRLFSS